MKKRNTKSMMIISVDFELQPFQIHKYINTHTYKHLHDMNIMKNLIVACRLKSKLNMYV